MTYSRHASLYLNRSHTKYRVHKGNICFSTLPIMIPIRQRDFHKGMYKIRESGYYKLEEDICFDPYPRYPGIKEDGFLLQDNPIKLGFFAAISIECANIILDLNGFTICQSANHYCYQRFFNIIELNNAAFNKNEGPFSGGENIAASNVYIKNGNLGLTSHSAIHGNNNYNVICEDIHITDFEVAGIHFNGIKNCTISNCRIHQSIGFQKKLPINGRFSASLYLHQLLKYCKLLNSSIINDFTLDCIINENDIKNITLKKILDKFDNIMDYMEGYIEDIDLTKISVFENRDARYMFGNKYGLPDGSAIYGILINKKGVAIGDLGGCMCPEATVTSNSEYIISENIKIINCQIYDLISKPNEIVAISDRNGKPCTDFSGSLLLKSSRRWSDNKLNQDRFWENSESCDFITLLQCFIIELSKQQGCEFLKGVSNLDNELLNWVKGELKVYAPNCYRNSDIMMHVMKGSFGIRLDYVYNGVVTNCLIENINNQCPKGFTHDALSGYIGGSEPENKHKGHPSSNTVEVGFTGNICRGISIVSCKNLIIKDIKIKDIISYSGSAFGIDLMHDNYRCKLSKINISNIYANYETYPCYPKLQIIESPNYISKTVGLYIRFNNKHCYYYNIDISNIYGIGSCCSILHQGDIKNISAYVSNQTTYQQIDYHINDTQQCQKTLH